MITETSNVSLFQNTTKRADTITYDLFNVMIISKVREPLWSMHFFCVNYNSTM